MYSDVKNIVWSRCRVVYTFLIVSAHGSLEPAVKSFMVIRFVLIYIGGWHDITFHFPDGSCPLSFGCLQE